MERNWTIQDNGDRKGPYTLIEVYDFIAAGKPGEEPWFKSRGEWMNLESLRRNFPDPRGPAQVERRSGGKHPALYVVLGVLATAAIGGPLFYFSMQSDQAATPHTVVAGTAVSATPVTASQPSVPPSAAIPGSASQMAGQDTDPAHADIMQKLRNEQYDEAYAALDELPQTDPAKPRLKGNIDLSLLRSRTNLLERAGKQAKRSQWDDASQSIDKAEKLAKTDPPPEMQVEIEKLRSNIELGRYGDKVTESKNYGDNGRFADAYAAASEAESMPHGEHTEHMDILNSLKRVGQLRLSGIPEGATVEAVGKHAKLGDKIEGLPIGERTVTVSERGYIPRQFKVEIQPYPEITSEPAVALVAEAPDALWAVHALRGRRAQNFLLAWYKAHKPRNIDQSQLNAVAGNTQPRKGNALGRLYHVPGQSFLATKALHVPGQTRFVLADGGTNDVPVENLLLGSAASKTESEKEYCSTVTRKLRDTDDAGTKLELMDFCGAVIVQYPDVRSVLFEENESSVAEFVKSMEHACSACQGTKKAKCPQCNGTKTVLVGGRCKACLGKRTLGCSRCNRTGYQTCDMCGGKGKVLKDAPSNKMLQQKVEVNCTKCRGQGKYPCKNEHCKSGQVQCRTCNGNGTGANKGKCQACDVKGLADCDVCRRTGKREQMLAEPREEAEKAVANAAR